MDMPCFVGDDVRRLKFLFLFRDSLPRHRPTPRRRRRREEAQTFFQVKLETSYVVTYELGGSVVELVFRSSERGGQRFALEERGGLGCSGRTFLLLLKCGK